MVVVMMDGDNEDDNDAGGDDDSDDSDDDSDVSDDSDAHDEDVGNYDGDDDYMWRHLSSSPRQTLEYGVMLGWWVWRR